MADYIFDDWKKILEDFQNSVSKDLEEIHKQKNEVQQMKSDIFDRLDSGQYITDDQRIVISAPEIVIGNVDKSGMLKDGGGKVIIRGSDIGLEGAGEMGSISQRAPLIIQTAVDPGSDGVEEVVYPHSAIISQARSITLESSDAKDAFSSTAPTLSQSGIRIHADKTLQVEAATSGDSHKKDVEELIKSLGKQKDNLKKTSDSQKKEIDKFFTDLKKLMDKEDKLNGDNDLIRANMVEMEQLRDQVEGLLPSLYRVTQDFIHTVSQLAEVTRKETALKAEKDAIKTGDDFRKEMSGASLTLTGEIIDIANKDGDGCLRSNVGAGINIKTPRMGIGMNQANGTLIEKSAFTLTTENVQISTNNPKEDGSEITGGGKVSIFSKDIALESMDYQKKDKLYTEKGLAADGKISIAAKTIQVSAAKPADVERDDKGKITKGNYTAEGDIILRSKNVSVETVDYEIADSKLKTKAVTSGSSMLLLSEKMMLGSEKKDVKSKKVQVVTEELGLFADKTLEAQQGEKKAVVQLADGKLGLGSDGNTVYGDLELKNPVKGPKATFDNVEAKSAFKSPNISDGMAAGGGGGGSISAKLTAEEVKE